MSKTIKYIALLFLLTFANVSFGQPSYIYEGGVGGGYSSDIEESNNTMLYKGGNDDGYTGLQFNTPNTTLYKGGDDNGYTGLQLNTPNIILYKGGNDNGYTGLQLNTPNTILYKGGNEDGYAFEEMKEDFIWTGAIGTGWTVAGNWNYNIIPDINRRTIIPAGVPHDPYVHAGLFAIGKNPNNGLFKSGELWIQEGAFLFTRINNRVENYGNIIIDGTMTVRKTTADAFKNLENGVVRISSTGSMIIKPL